MGLEPENIDEVVIALERVHPEVNRMSLTHAELGRMIAGLPDMETRPASMSDRYLSNVLQAWIALEDEEDEGPAG